MYRLLLTLLSTLLLLPAAAAARDEITFNVAMPDLSCGKGEQQPNECTLSGRLSARGPQTLNGPVKYYCDLRYTYVAAGSAQQEIRFSGRVLHHGEITLANGRAQSTLEVPVSITLSQKALRVELADIACYSK